MANTKSKKITSITIRENKGKDLSPKWDNLDQINSDQFLRKFRDSMDWYRLESSSKDLKPKVIAWMNANGYSKDEVAEFKKTRDSRCSLTMGAIASNLLKGMPDVFEGFNENRSSVKWLKDSIRRAISEGKNDIEDDEDTSTEVKSKPAGPSIQDRVREVAFGMTEEIEDAIEQFNIDPATFDPKAFKVMNLLKGKDAKAAHARIIRDFYNRQLDEYIEVAKGKDEQLVEGYSHLSKPELKKITSFYQEIISACDMLMQEAKISRKPKAKKSVPADKLVAKLRYQKSNEPMKLVSINPVDIVGAQELWVFNTKTRKIGKYVAEEYAQLSVKGTTIINFDESKSIQKTLRKPAEQLLEFKSAGKVALRKFLEDIKAVDIKLNGRINEETILLKVVS